MFLKLRVNGHELEQGVVGKLPLPIWYYDVHFYDPHASEGCGTGVARSLITLYKSPSVNLSISMAGVHVPLDHI